MTWDTQDSRNRAKSDASTPNGGEGPGWWSDANPPAPKVGASVRSTGATASVRATRAATVPAASIDVAGAAGGAGSTARTDGMLSARRTRRSRTASKSRSQFSPASVRLVVGFAIGVFGALFLVAAAAFGLSAAYDGKILPGVHAGDVDVSGMTRDQAVVAIDTAYASLGEGQVTITTPAGSQAITYAQIGRSADSAAMADAAMTIGHGRDALSSAASTIRTFAGGGQVPLMVKLDPTEMAKTLHGLTGASLRMATDAKVLANGGEFTIAPSATGSGIDEAAIQADIIEQLLQADAPSAISVGGHFVTLNPSVTDANAQAAIDAAGKMAVEVDLTYEGKTFKITPATVTGWIIFGFRSDATYGPVADPAKVATYVGTLAKDVNVSPVEPNVIYTGGKPTGVTTGKAGKALDVSATSQAIEVYLDGLGSTGSTSSSTIAMVMTEVQPSLAENPGLAGFVRIGNVVTTYFPSESNGFGTNIALPAKLLNGQVIGPHQQFSFLRAVTLNGTKPISLANGWKMGGVIKNGQSNHTGAIGGGICSASTTVFQAVAVAGLQVNERHAHFYWINRYALKAQGMTIQGLDATVYSNGNTTWDMRWTNDTDYPIVIRSWTAGSRSQGSIHVELWSMPNGRKTLFSKPSITDPVKAGDGTQYVKALPGGAKTYRKEYPTNGFNAFVSRTVTDTSGAVLHYDEWYSHYTKVDGLLQIAGTPQPPTPTPGPATPKPTPTPAITPPPTPAPTPTPRRRLLPGM
jgi:vancomycin resistance protein YoaR